MEDNYLIEGALLQEDNNCSCQDKTGLIYYVMRNG